MSRSRNQGEKDILEDGVLEHPAGTSNDSDKCVISKNSDLYTFQWTDVDITSF